MKLRLSSAFLGAIATLAIAAIPHPVSAITGADFQAGRIIDDAIFFDGKSMSAAQIQSFLALQVPTCDTNGDQVFTGFYNGTAGGVNHSPFAGGHTYTTADNVKRRALDDRYPAPYTCLKDYKENPTTFENNLGRPSYNVPGGISAAQIIANESSTYGISPKVMLVMLQKESVGPLPTDTWPWPSQFDHPLGYACYDGQPCDPAYTGFYRQVHAATARFRNYTNNPASYNYHIGPNQILYSPTTTSCPSPTRKAVTIANQATANLYIYTPYTPNQAALDNLYGTGDGCSAYGNRNFWRIFNGWFGSTLTPDYGWKLENVTVDRDLGNFVAGDTATVSLSIRNTGSTTWTKDGTNPVRLGTSSPLDRTSAFCTTGWLGCNRPAALTEASVAPNALGTFTFPLKAPMAAGEYREYFKPLIEGVTWLPDTGSNMYIKVVPPIYSYSVKATGAYTDSSKTTGLDLAKLSPGQTGWYTLVITNTGNQTWSNSGPNPMDLGTDTPRDRNSPFATPAWLGANRPARMREASVGPGQTATFEWPVQTANGNGLSKEYYTPVIEGVTWLNATGLNFEAQLSNYYAWAVTSQYAYTDSSRATGANLAALHPGQRVYVGIKAKNTGTATWFSGGNFPMHLGTTHGMDRSSAFCDPSWLGCNRPAAMTNADNSQLTWVAPGQTADFGFWYVAPSRLGTYYEYFNPVVENITWLNDLGVNHYTVVK